MTLVKLCPDTSERTTNWERS